MDAILLKQLQEKPDDAFKQFYDEYADYALRTAYAITKKHWLAADAVQETFIRIYHHIQSFDATKPFKPWFYRILLNECNRILKSNKKTVSFDAIKDFHPAFETYDSYNHIEYFELYECIQKLKDQHRIPLILKYLNDFSEKEIAQILHLNINTVKSRLYAARNVLKQQLSNNEKGSNNHECIR